MLTNAIMLTMLIILLRHLVIQCIVFGAISNFSFISK